MVSNQLPNKQTMPTLNNEEKIRIIASSKTINITLRDIYRILAGEKIDSTGNPLRDKLTMALFQLFHQKIMIPKAPACMVIPPSIKGPVEEGRVNPYVLSNDGLRDLIYHLEDLIKKDVKEISVFESILYIKLIIGIFKNRIEKKITKSSSENSRKIINAREDIEYAEGVCHDLFLRLTKKELELFDNAD